MENRSDIEKRLGEKLEAAYMLEEIPQGMSREDFHRLIQAAEKKKKRRRNMLSLAVACVALCLVCGGFVAGMTLGESATAGKDGETKIVQQGDSVIIGSGVGENDENVGVSTKTYTSIEDIPEDIRKGIHFLDSDEFELEKVKVTVGPHLRGVALSYTDSEENQIVITEEISETGKTMYNIVRETDSSYKFKNLDVYERESMHDVWCTFEQGNMLYHVSIPKGIVNKKEAIFEGLCG